MIGNGSFRSAIFTCLFNCPSTPQHYIYQHAFVAPSPSAKGRQSVCNSYFTCWRLIQSAAGISPRAPHRNEQPANSHLQNSNRRTATGKSEVDRPRLTKKNLKELNKLQLKKPLTASLSGTSTIVPPGHEEWLANELRRQYGSPVPAKPYKRTPSPSPHPDAAIARGPEKPRSAKTIQTTHKPHQCALGIKCTLEIENLNYHRIMATLLVARARECRMPVRAIDLNRDYNDLARLRGLSKYAADLLLERHQKWGMLWGMEKLHPREVLKEIQSPEYWDAERRYLESPGCLAERQKASASTLSAEVLPGTSSIDVGNHESPHQKSAAEGRLEFTQQGEVMAEGVSVAEQRPLQAPPRGTRSQTQLSTSLVSPADTASHDHPDNGKKSPASHPRLMGKNKPAAFPNISDWRWEQGHERIKKRKLTEDAVVGDDVASKRQKASEYAS